MRLQHISIVFILIFIPIILVTSYFVSLQVETIKMESDYNDKLLKSTYDAMRAFEINTANENLSSVSDSLRSIIEASNNIFFNTLCTNLGVSNASKSYVEPYIPAILYTLYDGYYIYSPTNVPRICVDMYGRTIRTSDYGVKYKKTVRYNGKDIGIYEFSQEAIKYNDDSRTEPEGLKPKFEEYVVDYSSLPDSIKQEYSQILYRNSDGTYSTELHSIAGNYDESTYYQRTYILKSYIPYSATYSDATGGGSGTYDITINYTLDNFITVEGRIGDIYYTKSGYLIKDGLVQKVEVDGVSIEKGNWSQISQEIIDSYIVDPDNHNVVVTLEGGVVITNRDGSVDVSNGTGLGTHRVWWEDAESAVQYYVDSFMFSTWFYDNLSGITASQLQNTQYSVTDIQNEAMSGSQSIIVDSTGKEIQTEQYESMLHDFKKDGSVLPFARTNNDPEDEESVFYTHKRNIIKNSITYNMILSMLVYTEESKITEFNMPVLKEAEWDRILNNVSIVTFMEGFQCGLKFFNNYAIVTSTNNEISVTDNEIYYVPRTVQDSGLGNGSQIVANVEDDVNYETAHRIDCEELKLGEADNFYPAGNWLGAISFKSKEIKYDKIMNSDGTYEYDHKAYTDYGCIVDSNYKVKNVGNRLADGTPIDETIDGNTNVLKYLTQNTDGTIIATDTNLRDTLMWKLRAYRIAIAKERNNLYKTTAFPENYGWQVINDPKPLATSATINLSGLTKKNLKEISKIEVIVENCETDRVGVYADSITASYGAVTYANKQTVATNSKSRRTLEFKEDFNNDSTISQLTISSANGTKFNLLSVRFYFK